MTTVTTLPDLNNDIRQSFGEITPDANRQSALDAFFNSGFPGVRSEEYRFTPVTKALEGSFNLATFARETPPSADFKLPKSVMQGQQTITLINGRLDGKLPSPTEVNILPLTTALQQSEVARKYFATIPLPQHDPFAALNSAFWSEGIFIHVPEKTAVSKPFVLNHIHDAHQQVITNNRILIVIEKGASLELIETMSSLGESPCFSNLVAEVMVAEGASFNYSRIQNDSGNVFQVYNSKITQSHASRVNAYSFTLGGKMIRNNFTVAVNGENCESNLYGLYLIGRNTLADNHTVVDHLKPNSFSSELYKGIMDDSSRGVFNGKIFVRPDAQKTNAFQSNRNILLTDTATVNTKPQLEIWADDVKCSHGCTTGQLDDEAVFYLRSRGIGARDARAILLNAFAGEVLDKIQNAEVKDYLISQVTSRLHSK